MKLKTTALALLTALVLHGAMLAQTTTSDLHEGTHFEVAFGYVWPESTERPLPDPFQIVITPSTAGVVTLVYGPPGARVTVIRPYETMKTLRIPIPADAVRPNSLGAIESKSVTVTSTSPISVCTWIGWNGNGNQTLHFPVAAWDTSYYAFSYPQDRFGYGYLDQSTMKHRPGQIAIVASEDSTQIEIRSPAVIASGPSIPTDIKRKETFVVTLNAHEVLTLAAEIFPWEPLTDATDLSGTRIRASKPISVISGHTKGAVGVYHKMLPGTGIFSAPAHFLRNCFTQAMLPNSLADTAFITIPLLYTATRVYHPQDTTQKSGDVIRILATEDNTEVRRLRADGGGYILLATLDAGEYYTALNVTEAHKWSTTKPAHVMQYGTSYAKQLPPGGVVGVVESKIEVPQGHPTVVAGMPTMIVVPGMSRWVSSATFNAPEGMDNFMNVTFKLSDLGNINSDSHVLNVYAGSMRLIAGTDLAYIRTAIGTGTHTLRGKTGSAAFMAWNYGSLDGLAQGRAYGHPVAVNLVRTCADEIDLRVTQSAGRAVVVASVDTACSSMLSYEIIANTNVKLDSMMQTLPSMTAYLSTIATDKGGSVTIRFTTTAGRWSERTIEFAGQPVSVTDDNESIIPTLSEHVRVYTYTGELVLELRDQVVNSHGQFTFNTDMLPRGAYVLHVSNGPDVRVYRLFVE